MSYDEGEAAWILKVTIIGAKGLRDADWAPGSGGSDPYCVCEIVGNPDCSTRTPTVANMAEPKWHHEAQINGYEAGDSLTFKVFDRDVGKAPDLLGKATLAGARFHPLGFEGELRLEKAGKGAEAYLHVKVEVFADVQAQSRSEPEEVVAPGGSAEGVEAGEVMRGQYNAVDVIDQVFEDLELPLDIAQEVQKTWAAFLRNAESREAAGEAVYAAIFEAAPSLQSLFKTPRAVMAMRFMNGLNQIVAALGDPKGLKMTVETLGFQHLDLEVTVPRVVIFRDAISDLLQAEMGGAFTPKAQLGWGTFLNYVGGAYIYIRVKFADRLRILGSSWATANNKRADLADAQEEEAAEAQDEGGEAEKPNDIEEGNPAQPLGGGAKHAENGTNRKKRGSGWGFGSKSAKGASRGSRRRSSAGNGSQDDEKGSIANASVPKTYDEMFLFNAAVMGFAGHTWMREVLSSFDTIVTNVSSSYRLQEECDILSLRMAKYRGAINLAEYKAVMLASLRSLVPKDWNSAHEVAWSWLWENVERMIKALMGKPAQQQAALAKLVASWDEKAQIYVRREVYSRFFSLAPAGQDYFKQSTTRLHFIADRLVDMTLDMYKEPKKMVEDISALGLRHVGYGIPTDLFGPFVTACVQVVRTLTDDDVAEEAFRWSLSLISRMLTRVINEGSTVVMKAINANSARQLRRAVGCAPRGKRALWVLNITVGTQFISPLLWAIETGSLEAAKGIIVDLLTIRADRDRYYFGMDTLFERHPDIVKRLCTDAPALLPTLLDGLVWRSRTAEGGRRRVNYYVKHLLVDAESNFAQALEWLVDNADPKVICHPTLVMVCDLVWTRVAQRTFLFGKSWFLFTLCVFISGQSILNHLGDQSSEGSPGVRVAIFAFRAFIYFFSLGGQVYVHTKHIVGAVRAREFVRVKGIPVPGYLMNWQDSASLILMLVLMVMFCTEPILHCLGHVPSDSAHIFTAHCPKGEQVVFAYSVWSMFAMLFYFLLLSDLSVFSTRVSAFALVCGRVLSEVGLFLFGFGFLLVAFASAVSSLEHKNTDFTGIPSSLLALGKITLGMYSGVSYEALHRDPMLLAAIFAYVIGTVIFLLNLLIGQLNCAYQSTYEDMVGLARLNRGKIVVEAMPSVSLARWYKFIDVLRLEERCQFGEGDIGVAGGLQIWEPAALNVTTVDMIQRFGGSTSPAAQWPQVAAGVEDEDKFERMEKMMGKTMKRISSSSKGSRSKKGGSSMTGSSFNQIGSSAGEEQMSQSDHGSE